MQPGFGQPQQIDLTEIVLSPIDADEYNRLVSLWYPRPATLGVERLYRIEMTLAYDGYVDILYDVWNHPGFSFIRYREPGRNHWSQLDNSQSELNAARRMEMVQLQLYQDPFHLNNFEVQFGATRDSGSGDREAWGSKLQFAYFDKTQEVVLYRMVVRGQHVQHFNFTDLPERISQNIFCVYGNTHGHSFASR